MNEPLGASGPWWLREDGGTNPTRRPSTLPWSTNEAGGETSRCRFCRHVEPSRIISVIGEFLFRCPKCGAYDWTPAPIEKVGRVG